MAEQDFIAAIGEVVTEWAQDYGDKMRASLLRHDHVDSAGGGNLYQALAVDGSSWVDPYGDTAFAVKLELPFYYRFLNKGRGPGRGYGAIWASLSGPTGWIARKGIDVRKATGIKDSIEANRILGFIIAKSINKKGYKASHWFDEVWGGDPIPDSSPALQDLRLRIIKKIGNADFLLSIIDPNKP
jgi:hypothetical protein